MAKKARRERRIAPRCLFCGSVSVTRETTLKFLNVKTAWRCASCGKTWPERRRRSD